MTAVPFEGPEKKLEVILKRPLPALRSTGHSSPGRSSPGGSAPGQGAPIDPRWAEVVQAAGAKIVSFTSTEAMDAYLLSESSLFVWDDRVLMITCGTTSLIDAVPRVIETVAKENIAFFFYERKNLMYPELQRSDFETDAEDLAAYFEGKSYRLGPANRDHIHIFYYSTPNRPVENDITLEILMHDLHPEARDAFVPRPQETIDQMEARTGVDDLYPDMVKDAFRFQPYGYSLNKVHGESYMTIHVTPEPHGSYASFETNVTEQDYTETIKRVISIFRPNRFSLAMTGSQDENQTPQENLLPQHIRGFQVTESSFYEFDSGYAVTFRNYSAHEQHERAQ